VSGGAAGPRARALPTCARTWLFTPADQQRRLVSAARSRADVLIADLEDAVAPESKDEARAQAMGFLRDGGAQGPLRVVRINDPHSEAGRRDLQALAALAPVTAVVPKASLESLALASASGLTSAIALVETARGVSEAERIAELDGVLAIAIGTIDLAAQLGLRALPQDLQLLHFRSRIVLACALAGIPAIDGVHVGVGADAALREQAMRSRALGFAGMLCIHPSQLEPVRAAFSPSAAELAAARRTLDAYERAREQRGGATLLDGEMVDLATVRVAERVIAGAQGEQEPQER